MPKNEDYRNILVYSKRVDQFNSIQNEFLKKKSLVLKKGKIYVKHIVSFLIYAFRLFISQTK